MTAQDERVFNAFAAGYRAAIEQRDDCWYFLSGDEQLAEIRAAFHDVKAEL